MAWKREGLLTDAEFERAKEKILAEESIHGSPLLPRAAGAAIPERPAAPDPPGKEPAGQGRARLSECR